MGHRDVAMARAAWAVVEALPTEAKARREFRSRARALPAMLQTSGLAATVAFIKAKSTSGSLTAVYEATGRALWDWVKSEVGPEAGETDEMIDWINRAGGVQYELASRSAGDFAEWLKRAAEAEITS